jgi:hypothetical protein
MIRYALRCRSGHTFESWFQSSSAYDSQIKRKLVACPVCDITDVEKAIMAPRLAGTRKTRRAVTVSEPVVSAALDDATSTAPLMMAPHERELLQKLKKLRDHVVKNADNVGKKFPDEARKMHYGDIEHRAIYGEATVDEARALTEEGVDVMPLPVLPGDRN